jgi:galactan 5-O-arabinofuranosyltransferase
VSWWATSQGWGPPPLSPLLPALLNGTAVLLCLALGAAWFMGWRRWPERLAGLTVAVVAMYQSTAMMLALSGTPWGTMGLLRDKQFRTQAVSRFSEHLGNVDHSFQGLPGHYPPLIPWLEARLAPLLGLEAWQVVKPGELVLAALVPLLAYVFWRRVVPAPVAAAVVAGTSLFSADLFKPDQWLVLTVVVPWWLEAFRRSTRPGVRPWPPWFHGVIAGLLLTVFTFYFLPLAVATVVGLVIDLWRRRHWRAALGQPVVIVVVGLLVSSWYWWPLVSLRLQGAPMENYQLGWFGRQHTDIVSPLDEGAVGLVMAGGIVFLVATVRQRLSQGLLLAGFSGYAVLGGGLVLTAFGVPMLVFKAVDYITFIMLAAGILGIIRLGSALVRRRDEAVRAVAVASVVVLLALVSLTGASKFTDSWTTGEAVVGAHATRLPDGSLPRHGETAVDQLGRAMGSPDGTDAILNALRVGPRDEPVLLVDSRYVVLFATTTVHPFVVWSRSYSNPFGQFDERIAMVRELSQRDPEGIVELAEDNPYDEIEGLVLRKDDDGWVYRYRTHHFPRGTVNREVRFRPEQFDHPHWEVEELESTVVVRADPS